MKVFKSITVNVITILMWIGFIYCINHYIEIDLVIKTTYIALASFIIIIAWKTYNIKRFGKLKRRTYPLDTTLDDLVEFFGISKDKIMEFQKSKVIVLEKNLINYSELKRQLLDKVTKNFLNELTLEQLEKIYNKDI